MDPDGDLRLLAGGDFEADGDRRRFGGDFDADGDLRLLIGGDLDPDGDRRLLAGERLLEAFLAA